MAKLKITVNDELSTAPLVVQAPPTTVQEPTSHYSQHRSVETLVVVLAVITILAVVAGFIARFCGGRHFGGSGEHDIEGWVERKCRSCIDGGVPTSTVAPPLPPPPPQQPEDQSKAAAAEEAKK